jgi:hypothetical protein
LITENAESPCSTGSDHVVLTIEKRTKQIYCGGCRLRIRPGDISDDVGTRSDDDIVVVIKMVNDPRDVVLESTAVRIADLDQYVGCDGSRRELATSFSGADRSLFFEQMGFFERF